MIKRILEVVGNIFMYFVLIFILVYNVSTVQMLKKEQAYMAQGIKTILYTILDFDRHITDGIKRDIGTLEKIKQLQEIIKGIQLNQNSTIDLIRILNQKINQNEIMREKLMLVNVMVYNSSIDSLGGGITLKYKNKYYILSVNHLIEKDTDELWLMESNEYICKLKIIKTDKTRDLALFRLEDKNIVPRIYSELADIEPQKGTKIYTVGNPIGIEDVFAEGTVITSNGLITYFINHIYFGHSGGGIYNTNGEVVGVIDFIQPIYAFPFESGVPPYVIHGAIRLNQIKAFLGDIK